MKITFLLPSIGISGGVRVVFEYANNLVDRGHDVTILYPKVLTSQLILRISPNHFFIKSLVYKTIKSLSFFSKPRIVKDQDLFKLKVKLIEIPTLDEKYIPDADIIIATWWETALYLNKYSISKGKKFYFVQHYEVWGGPEELVNSTYKLDFKKIVIAKWIYEKLIELGVPKNQLAYVPNAIDLRDFKLIEKIEERKSIVTMQFNDNVYKGMGDGIEALKLVKNQFKHLEAILFGIDPRPKNIPKWIEYVRNPSQQYLVENIYNKSSIYLCPSLSEGWGLPGAEAMACGCALVSTDNGGVNDYAIHGVNALLSPPNNPKLLAENLLQLLKNYEFRIKLANAGFMNIKKFNWDKSTDRLENLLRS